MALLAIDGNDSSSDSNTGNDQPTYSDTWTTRQLDKYFSSHGDLIGAHCRSYRDSGPLIWRNTIGHFMTGGDSLDLYEVEEWMKVRCPEAGVTL